MMPGVILPPSIPLHVEHNIFIMITAHLLVPFNLLGRVWPSIPQIQYIPTRAYFCNISTLQHMVDYCSKLWETGALLQYPWWNSYSLIKPVLHDPVQYVPLEWGYYQFTNCNIVLIGFIWSHFNASMIHNIKLIYHVGVCMSLKPKHSAYR